MEEFRHGSGSHWDFPAFRIGLPFLLAMVAIGGGGQWLLDRDAERTALAASTATSQSGAYAARSALHSTLLRHVDGLGEILAQITSGQEQRDSEILRAAHLALLSEIDALPELAPNASPEDRDLHLTYHGVLAALEDGVDDLIEGLRDDDPLEWNEGERELRLARSSLQAFLDR